MSNTPSTDAPVGDTDEATGGETEPRELLETEVAVLREENQRLRAEHRRLLRSNYRRSALGFAVLAALAAGAAVVFDAVQDVLLAIAAIAAFASLLTYYLTPERFVAATVGESIYQTVARTGRDLINDLGLHDTQLYLPAPDGTVRVFVPQHRAYERPALEDHEGVLVVPGNERARGITLRPTGAALFDAFETTTGHRTADRLPAQLAEALVEQFELVDSATVDSREPGRATIAIAGSAYGGVDQFDHPVGSLLATGLAATHDTAVELDTTASETPRADYLITCRWEPDDSASENSTEPAPD